MSFALAQDQDSQKQHNQDQPSIENGTEQQDDVIQRENNEYLNSSTMAMSDHDYTATSDKRDIVVNMELQDTLQNLIPNFEEQPEERDNAGTESITVEVEDELFINPSTEMVADNEVEGEANEVITDNEENIKKRGRKNSSRHQPYTVPHVRERMMTRSGRKSERLSNTIGKALIRNSETDFFGDYNENEPTPTQYEVDYIFGKRPSKNQKGKVEYHVFWKGFQLDDATWEPEENLLTCPQVVQAYLQTLSSAKRTSFGKRSSATGNRRKSESANNLTSAPLSSTNSPRRTRSYKARSEAMSTGPESVLPGTSTAVGSSSSTTTISSTAMQKILMVKRVYRSDIEGVGMVADVLLKDGSNKRMRNADLKKMAPFVLIEYYEQELGLSE